MVPTWTIPADAGGNLQKTKHTPIQFPILKVWLIHLLLCEPFHEVPHLISNLLPCDPAAFHHMWCSFFFLISLWHWTVRLKAKNVSISSLSSHAENNLSYPHLKPQVRFTLSKRPFLTHLIWLNPPPLCFHSTLASFCHGVHHSVLLLFYVYLSLHRDSELLEVSGSMSSSVQEND